MQDNLMILSECDEINSLLQKPIATTLRIKYTCLNVSPNYIVLGSTSGSLYLFIREPCAFQHIIPLSEGPVSCVVISPDEKTVALATKRGSVCLIGIKPTIKLLAVSSEHLGEMVTSLCWNDNSSEIYIGDGIGKISTMVLSKFSVNGMFQAPSCALMHLDSTIVQMQFSGHLLLVSTMTRCYICDTAQEQFKQIGNKARDGEFGACFLASKWNEGEKSPKLTKRDERERDKEGKSALFPDTNGDAKDETETKIYCARPGCRLWEVTINGTVVKTHQFKDALAISPAQVYHPTALKSSKNRQPEHNRTPLLTSTNFSHLYILCGKYLFSYTSGSIYVIDPKNAAVILWNNEYTNITMARTINDRIYLMKENGIFHCLRLVTPETLILQFYEKKNYFESLRVCKTLKPEYLKSTISKNHLLQSVNDEREYSSNDQYEIAAILVPIISLIQSNINSPPVKLNSGIVVVNDGSGKIRLDEKRNFDKALKNGLGNDKNTDRCENDGKFNDENTMDLDPVIYENLVRKRERASPQNIDGDTENCEDLMKNLNINDKLESPEENENSLENIEIDEATKELDETTSQIQKDLNPLYVMINSLKPSMRANDFEEIIMNIRKTMSDMNDNYGNIEKLKDFLYEILRSTERHYYNILLETTTEDTLMETKNEIFINEVVRSFVDINASGIAECSCGYVYPSEKPREPKFFEIGKTLLHKFLKDGKRENCIKLCNAVSFMWRCYLPMSIVDFSVNDDLLSTCLHTRDNVVLSILLPLLDVRQWEIAVKCIKNMETNVCPSCGKRDETLSNRKKMEIDWTEVARELMKREGTSSAMTFLILIETVLPNVTLDKSIFQSLIFNKILDRHGLEQVVDFDRNDSTSDEYGAMFSPEVQETLLESMEKDLERPVEKNIFGTGPHHWGMRLDPKSSICPSCTLSLHTPVLLGDNGISLFPCGHVYHVSCLIQKKLTRCNLH